MSTKATAVASICGMFAICCGTLGSLSAQQPVSSSSPAAACAKIVSDGTAKANQVTKFTGACKIEPSAISELGGNVGIGTTNPGGTLDITTGATQLLLGASSNAGLMKLRRPSDGSANGYLGYGWMSQTADGPLALVDANGQGEVRLDAYSNDGIVTAYTNNTERLRVDSSGNLGIVRLLH